MKKLFILILSIAMLLSLCSCTNNDEQPKKNNNTVVETPAKEQQPEENNTVVTPAEENTQINEEEEISAEAEQQTTEISTDPIAFEIEMEDGSVMKGELYPDIAPITVDNFVKLCKEDFYAGTIFHRVIEGFMIQGGGYIIEDTDAGKTLVEKSAAEIKGEFNDNGVENNLKHERGVLSMARTQVHDSASSQFFIMHETSPHLDDQYAAFGRITEGLDVVDRIATTETGAINAMFTDFPIELQVIKTIRIVEN